MSALSLGTTTGSARALLERDAPADGVLVLGRLVVCAELGRGAPSNLPEDVPVGAFLSPPLEPEREIRLGNDVVANHLRRRGDPSSHRAVDSQAPFPLNEGVADDLDLAAPLELGDDRRVEERRFADDAPLLPGDAIKLSAIHGPAAHGRQIHVVHQLAVRQHPVAQPSARRRPERAVGREDLRAAQAVQNVSTFEGLYLGSPRCQSTRVSRPLYELRSPR